MIKVTPNDAQEQLMLFAMSALIETDAIDKSRIDPKGETRLLPVQGDTFILSVGMKKGKTRLYRVTIEGAGELLKGMQ